MILKKKRNVSPRAAEDSRNSNEKKIISTSEKSTGKMLYDSFLTGLGARGAIPKQYRASTCPNGENKFNAFCTCFLIKTYYLEIKYEVELLLFCKREEGIIMNNSCF